MDTNVKLAVIEIERITLAYKHSILFPGSRP